MNVTPRLCQHGTTRKSKQHLNSQLFGGGGVTYSWIVVPTELKIQAKYTHENSPLQLLHIFELAIQKKDASQ